jgi:hypothetical protein
MARALVAILLRTLPFIKSVLGRRAEVQNGRP